MVLDSGTVRTTLDEAVARRLGLDLSMKAQSSGAKGMQEISVIKDRTLRFCGVDTVEPLMVSFPLDFISKRFGRRVESNCSAGTLSRSTTPHARCASPRLKGSPITAQARCFP